MRKPKRYRILAVVERMPGALKRVALKWIQSTRFKSLF